LKVHQQPAFFTAFFIRDSSLAAGLACEPNRPGSIQTDSVWLSQLVVCMLFCMCYV
jgi:hypothetical protein